MRDVQHNSILQMESVSIDVLLVVTVQNSSTRRLVHVIFSANSKRMLCFAQQQNRYHGCFPVFVSYRRSLRLCHWLHALLLTLLLHLHLLLALLYLLRILQWEPAVVHM